MSQVANTELEPLTDEECGSPDPFAVSVAEGYESWAATYDRDPNPLLAREERYLLPLFADLRGKRILDLACGTGRWLEKLMASGAESGAGIDYSLAMLREAQKKYSTATRLARSACEKLPFRNAAFDVVICSFALGHLRDLQSIVEEVARIVKRGADVFTSDLHPEAYSHGWRVGFRKNNASIQIATVPRSAEEILETFLRSGFDCLACDSLWLGEAERPVFIRAGKASAFDEACQVPAVLVSRFRRVEG